MITVNLVKKFLEKDTKPDVSELWTIDLTLFYFIFGFHFYYFKLKQRSVMWLGGEMV